MPTKVWYFYRTCACRGQFVAEPEDVIECPECRKRYVTTIMRRHDVIWAKESTKPSTGHQGKGGEGE